MWSYIDAVRPLGSTLIAEEELYRLLLLIFFGSFCNCMFVEVICSSCLMTPLSFGSMRVFHHVPLFCFETGKGRWQCRNFLQFLSIAHTLSVFTLQSKQLETASKNHIAAIMHVLGVDIHLPENITLLVFLSNKNFWPPVKSCLLKLASRCYALATLAVPMLSSSGPHFLETCLLRFLYLPATSTLHPQVRSSGQFKFHCPHVHTWCDRKRRWSAHCAALNVHDIICCAVNNTHTIILLQTIPTMRFLHSQHRHVCFLAFFVLLLRPAHYPHAVSWQCTTLQNMSPFDSTV